MSAQDVQRRRTNGRILAVFAGVAVLLLVVVAVAAALSGGDEDSDRAVPAYTIASEQGGAIDVRVEAMPAGDGLRAVFDDVRTGKSRPDGGYFVSINCTTGGSAGADNRLGNGKFAVGQLGAAQTGLPAGGHEFEPVAERTCPA